MIRKFLAAALLLTLISFGQNVQRTPAHPDYVPDAKTAEQIAEAVLVAQFGQKRVDDQLPLRAVSASKSLWLVQGTTHGLHGPGGNFGVWIDKHRGCLKVMEHMK